MRAPGSPSGDRALADAGVIEVHVRERAQLFDSMDPSPFHETELDADAEDYIDLLLSVRKNRRWRSFGLVLIEGRASEGHRHR